LVQQPEQQARRAIDKSLTAARRVAIRKLTPPEDAERLIGRAA